MTYRIDPDSCHGCVTAPDGPPCMNVCPSSAIRYGENGKPEIVPDGCTDCDACAGECPEDAILAPEEG